MNSYILKGQRDSFVKSCDDYLEMHQQILTKISEIESLLSTSTDTLSVEYIRAINEKLIKAIAKLDSNVTSSKSKTIRTVNNKIEELEYQEKESSKKNKEKNLKKGK